MQLEAAGARALVVVTAVVATWAIVLAIRALRAGSVAGATGATGVELVQARGMRKFRVDRDATDALTVYDNESKFLVDSGSGLTLVSETWARARRLRKTSRVHTQDFLGGSARCHMSNAPTRVLGVDAPVYICADEFFDCYKAHNLVGNTGAQGIIGLTRMERSDETSRAPNRYTYDEKSGEVCIGEKCPRLAEARTCQRMRFGDGRINPYLLFPALNGNVVDTGTTTSQLGIDGFRSMRALDVTQYGETDEMCVNVRQ